MTENAPLFSLQRRERLMDELRSHGSVVVRDVALSLGVSELTIRRDINALAQQGLVTRVHGGATLRSALDRSLPPVAVRESATARYTIGVLVPSLDYYWPQVMIGARATGNRAHARIVLRGSTYEAADNRRQIQALLDMGGVHGLIVAPDTDGAAGRELLRWLDRLPIPVVLAERRAHDDDPALRLESVSTDHAFGAGLAVRHLYEQGHRGIGLLTSPTSPTSKHIERGWARALQALGLPVDSALKADALAFNSADRERIMDDILRRCVETDTTALLVHSDPQALAFEQHCIDRGLAIPDDLALVAYDDEVAHLGMPPITAVRPPKQHVGRLAVELMVARLEEGLQRPVQRVRLNPELIVRGSSTDGGSAEPDAG